MSAAVLRASSESFRARLPRASARGERHGLKVPKSKSQLGRDDVSPRRALCEKITHPPVQEPCERSLRRRLSNRRLEESKKICYTLHTGKLLSLMAHSSSAMPSPFPTHTSARVACPRPRNNLLAPPCSGSPARRAGRNASRQSTRKGCLQHDSPIKWPTPKQRPKKQAASP